MANKLVQQQLKNVLRGLNDNDIEKILSTYEILSNTQINKNCRMVSYKCYEATMTHKTLTANGYGRTEVEASANCIKNFLEMIMEDEGCLALLIKALKKGNESSSHNAHGRDHHEKSSNVNNTLALNGSYAQVPENNNSFENKKELEILSKNIGNISVIGNQRASGDVNPNMSQLEMDDLLLKMMLEDGTNPANAHANTNQFRKNLPPQHPNGLDLGGGQGTKTYNNIYKTEKASQFSHATPNTDETKKSAQESTNVHQHPGRYSLDAQKDERDENKKENGTPSNQYHKSKSSSSSKQLEGRHSYNHHHHHGNSSETLNVQKEAAPHRESVGGYSTSNNQNKCFCNCSEQLQRANLRIESLEKKLKLLTEENKILKYLTSDNKEKEFSTQPSTNGVPTKSVYEKSIGNYDLTPHENYEDINEFPERESNKDQNENKRSHSLDVYARKKNFMEHNNQKNVMNYNKENANNTSMEKRDARKMVVPRLKLEMIPNYHAKFSNPSSTNVLGHQNTNTLGATKGYTQQALQNPSITNFYSQNSFESTVGAGGTLSSLSKYIKK